MARPHQVLPTSVPVPVTTTVVTRDRAPRARAAQRADLVHACARPTARRAAATCPAGTVGGRIAGTSSPRSSSARGRGERALLVAADDRDDRRRVPGPQLVDVRPQPGAQRVALRRLRTTASAASAAAASAGVGAVVKMYERARFTTSSVSARRPGDEAAERARASSTACRRAARRVGPGSSRSGPSTAWASSSTSSAPWSRAQLGERVDVGDVAVHREHGVADDERAAAVGPVAQQRVERAEVAVPVDRDLAAGEPAAVDDRRVVELVRADERARAAERGEHAEVRGEAGREEHRGLGALPVGERALELGVHRPRADDEPRRARSRCPTGRAPRARPRSTAGCWVRPR